ncbi:MAG: hypothetical protein KAT35_04415, partial [Candidatus Aenigmarchaeota archaeon]|nr:hypothetical protein [Candidatus Aenigmarchaeota archaeon]
LTELKKSKLSTPMDYDTLAGILDAGVGDGYILRSDVPKKSGDLKNIILRDSTSDSEYMFILGENVDGVFIRDDNLRFLCFGCGEVSDLSHLYYKSDLMIGEGKNHPTRRTLYLNLEYICEKCSQSLAEVQFQFNREFIVDKNIPYIF